ncbi:MAG: 2'-5' RNA ligase family protein [Oligoflexia bacterium]|nr:2'-5' RNA ligase family protein [Oligoflexia bacterium]
MGKKPQNQNGNGAQASSPHPQQPRPPRDQNQNRNRNQRPQPNQGNAHHGGQRRRQNRHRQPPRPMAYLQRDILLIATQESNKSLEEVRAKYDPLVKKLPAHITLVLPEPAGLLSDQLFNQLPESDLKALSELTFVEIVAYDDRYLWLMPDKDSAEKIRLWRDHYVGKLEKHTQGDEFEPHITLGYIPRKTTPEDALSFAKGLINLPVTLKFSRLLLEEFEENQISKPIKELNI